MCGAPTWARSRPPSDGRDRADRPGPAGAARSAAGRALRARRRGPLARLRRAQGARRGPWRADHAGRLRHLLALRAAPHRSLRLPAPGHPGRARAGRGALRVPVRLRGPRPRGDPHQELAAGRLRPGARAPRAGRAALDRGRSLGHDTLQRRGAPRGPARHPGDPAGEPGRRVRSHRGPPSPAGPLALGQGHPGHRGGLAGRAAHRHRRAARLSPRLRDRHRARRGGRHPGQRGLLDQPRDGSRVDAQGLDRRGAGRPRLDAGHLRSRALPRCGRGPERRRLRWALSRSGGPGDLRGGADAAAAGPLRKAPLEMSRDRAWTAVILLGLAALAPLPLLTRRDDVLNFVLLVLLSITMAQSWNIIAGYAGQVNLGHAAFFGLGALTARTLWIAGAPILLAMAAGALVAVAFALLIGAAAFRLRGAYFAIGTLALGEILRTFVSNTLPEISTLPGTRIAEYRLAPRYYLALALAALSVIAVAALAGSRLGLGVQAIRE